MGFTSKLKYVVIDGPYADELFIFQDHITHADFVQLMRTTPKYVLGAGFIRNGQCFGESVSLKVKSRPEDTELFSKLMADTD